MQNDKKKYEIGKLIAGGGEICRIERFEDHDNGCEDCFFKKRCRKDDDGDFICAPYQRESGYTAIFIKI